MSAQKKLKQSKNNTEFLTNKENFLKFANSIKLVSPIFGLEKAEFTATHGLLFEAIENHDHVAVFRQRQYFHMSTFFLVYCLWLAEINKFPQRIGFFCTNGLSSVLKQKGFQELLKNNKIPFKTLADTIKLKDSGVEIQFQPAALFFPEKK